MTPDLPSADVLLFLNTKPDTTLRAASRCCSEKLVDSGTGSLPPAAGHMHLQPQARRHTTPAKRCKRPIWGDGFVDGVRFDLCSQCWYEWAAFHSGYRLLQANPAASQIDDVGLERLFVDRGMDGMQRTEPIDALEVWARLQFDPRSHRWGEAA